MSSISWELFQKLYVVETLQGYTEAEIKYLTELFGALPQVLEEYYRVAGRTEAFHQVQDEWILPEHLKRWDWLRQLDYMVLLNENQGVCRAGIRRQDLSLPDPPVYYTEDDRNWVLCAPTASGFLSAALAYEAVFRFPYGPEEFYCITEAEVAFIQENLKKFPYSLEKWVSGMKVTLFQNEADNMVAIMDCGDGSPSMLYGAARESSYGKLQAVLEGIGEAM